MKKPTIEDLLIQLDPGTEIKLVEDPREDLTPEQKDTLIKELESIVAKVGEKNDTFLYSINRNMDKNVSLTLLSLEEPVDTCLQNTLIFKNQTSQGSTCQICPNRIRCLYLENGLCFTDSEIAKQVELSIRQTQNTKYDKESLRSFLENKGFRQKSFLGKVPLTDVYEKDRLIIYLE